LSGKTLSKRKPQLERTRSVEWVKEATRGGSENLNQRENASLLSSRHNSEKKGLRVVELNSNKGEKRVEEGKPYKGDVTAQGCI